MKLKSKILAHKEPLFEFEISNSYKYEGPFIVERICIQNGEIEKIEGENLISDGIVISDIQMRFSTSQTVHFEIKGESILLNFICNKNVVANIDQVESEKTTTEQTHNILYTNNLNSRFEIPAFEEINCFTIILSLDYYYKLLNGDRGIHKQFSKNIEQKKANYLKPKYAAFTPAIQWVIHDIKNCKFEGSLKKMYLETKIKELLILQLDTLIVKPENQKNSIDEEDYHKLLQAKLILETNFANAPTLPELSRAISLNEFKLKKGFKTCFETTIKSYTTKLRMEYAKKLFQIKALNVGEVAEKCGYKDVSHFSAAFKLFYGFTPISFRKQHLGIKLSFLYWELLDIISLEVFMI